MVDKVIVSKSNQALAVPRTAGMMGLFPEGKPIDNYWVIKHGLSEYSLLSKLGCRVPNPIQCYYDWCNGKPFSVQKITSATIISSPRAYILNHMGTGKTRTVLWSWDYLRSNNYAEKLLIVAPLETLNNVWAKECFRTIPHRKFQVLHGHKKKRLERLNDPEAEIFIINHDGVKVILDELSQRKDIDVLAIDELATFRNNNTRSKMMLKLAERMKFAWGLTGSPMPQEPTDVWMQCRILTPHTVPKYRSHARDMLMTRHSEFVWMPKEDATERAFSWMQPAVRFSLDDVVELPDIIYRNIDIPLTPQQHKVYTTVARELVADVEAQKITAINAATAMGKLLQIAGGYVYSASSTVIELDVSPRKNILLSLINSATGKVLVFFPYRHMVAGLAKFLQDKDEFNFAVVHGDIPTKERDQIYSSFQETSQYKAILAHPRCMRHGLTLTAADTVIWYCPIASLETYEQANARIRRVGQKHRQQIFHLQGTPVERKLYRLLEHKELAQNKLLAMFEEATLLTEGAIDDSGKFGPSHEVRPNVLQGEATS